MDDKFIYYLVIGAIYLVSRMLKKKKPVAPTTPQQQGADEEYYESESQYEPPKSAKPSSFEDLLKEISQEFEERKEPRPVAQVIKPIEEITAIPVKEELTREQKYVNKRRKEAAETLHRETIISIANKEDEHEPHAVLELLHEEGGAANAVVLAEILNRRF